MKLRSVRGTHDLFGEKISNYNYVHKIVSKHANLNNFTELQTPIFENSDLFVKPLGEQSDVVLKEMYTFKDRNEEFLTLRPEYTTPMIRAAISNNMFKELPLKVFGIGPMFRRERPQKGRYRQFNQINFEIFGITEFLADLEIIVVANDILKSLIKDSEIELNLNTLGGRNDLKRYKLILSKYFEDNKKKLSEESINKIHLNPLRILDSKNENDIDISNSAPKIIEYISEESKIHFDKLRKGLKHFNIEYKENNNLVRGLDYYCGTVFEFKTKNLGSQDTLLGGGRYDGLIKILGGPDISGIGFAAGIERISMLMKNINSPQQKIHLAINNSKFIEHLFKIIKYLKEKNIPHYWNYKYNLKKSLSKANIDKAKFIIIIGENEFKNDTFIVKELITGKQIELKINKLFDFINDKS